MPKENAPHEPADDRRRRAIAEAMSHPQRAKVFFAVADQVFRADPPDTEDVPRGVTVREIASRAGEPERRVRYHLTVLVDLGLVETLEPRQRRGVMEKRYRVTQLPLVTLQHVETGEISLEQQQMVSIGILKSLFADVTAALSAGTYNRRPEWVAVRLPADVDEQGWRELSVIQEAAAAEAQEVVLRAKQRLSCTGERPTPMVSGFLLFEASR